MTRRLLSSPNVVCKSWVTVSFSKSHHSMDPGRTPKKYFSGQALLYLCGLMILCTALRMGNRDGFLSYTGRKVLGSDLKPQGRLDLGITIQGGGTSLSLWVSKVTDISACATRESGIVAAVIYL